LLNTTEALGFYGKEENQSQRFACFIAAYC
jgi:hypothetical protein